MTIPKHNWQLRSENLATELERYQAIATELKDELDRLRVEKERLTKGRDTLGNLWVKPKDEIAELRAAVTDLRTLVSEIGAERDGLRSENEQSREAHKSALLVLCVIRDAQSWHQNMLKDIDFAIEATRAALEQEPKDG